MDYNKRNMKTWSRLGPRATYGLAMLELVENNSEIYALSADLGASSGLGRLMEHFPEHYLNVGIAEQNLIGVAAGMAREGLIPFASSFAPFITHRCADQVRMNMGYMHLNIKTVGLGSGISMGILGNSHYGSEDISFIKSIPGMVVLSPCDCAELIKSVKAAAEYVGPVYIRMTGEPGMPCVYSEDFSFEIGKANKLCDGKDIMIIATGSMVDVAIKASECLNKKNVKASVINMHTIKPLDSSVFEDISGECNLIVTIEEHNVVSGLGSEVNRLLATREKHPPVLNIGLPDAYLKTGSYSYMLDLYGLTADKVTNKIIERLELNGI